MQGKVTSLKLPIMGLVLHPQASEESHGLQLVREGRGARLEAVHRQLFGNDGDRDRDRDQRQLQQLQPASRGLGSALGRDGSSADRLGRSPGRPVAGRSSVDAQDNQAGAGSSPGRQQLPFLAALADGSGSGGQSPARWLGDAGGARRGLLGQRQPLGGSPGNSDSAAAVAGGDGSPLRRDAAAVTSRWAGRFATASPATNGSPAREELLPQSQERS